MINWIKCMSFYPSKFILSRFSLVETIDYKCMMWWSVGVGVVSFHTLSVCCSVENTWKFQTTWSLYSCFVKRNGPSLLLMRPNSQQQKKKRGLITSPGAWYATNCTVNTTISWCRVSLVGSKANSNMAAGGALGSQRWQTERASDAPSMCLVRWKYLIYVSSGLSMPLLSKVSSHLRGRIGEIRRRLSSPPIPPYSSFV